MSEQKSSKRPPLPLVLTGNDLLGGHVVWFDGKGWTTVLAEATVAQDDEAADELQAVLDSWLGRIVEPYFATVALAGGRPLPTHYREKIRLVGPTFAEGAPDVSL